MLTAEPDTGIPGTALALTYRHIHPGRQILLVTDGQGYYQENGKPTQLLNKGDIAKIPPGVEHWHGAKPENGLTHIAIRVNTEKGKVIWLQAVTDEEYNISGAGDWKNGSVCSIELKVAILFPLQIRQQRESARY